MSWDVMIIRVPESIQTLEDLNEHPDPNPLLPLCTRDEFQAKASSGFPGTDWSDPSWGIWAGEEGSVEFNVGDDEIVDNAMLHVRAADAVVARIIALIGQEGWKAIDTTAGEFLAAPDDTAGIAGWRAYRDAVIGDGSAPADGQ